MGDGSEKPRNSIKSVTIRPLQEQDISEADRVYRLAFGSFIGLPDPAQFGGDTDCIRTRWLTDKEAAFVAEQDGVIVGSNFAVNWGSVGYLGPLTVLPDLWGQHIGHRLIEPVMRLFSVWAIQHAGLVTFAYSPKHIELYQKFGFWPRFLSAIMYKKVNRPRRILSFTRYSEISEREKSDGIIACRELTNSIYEGLNVEREIRSVSLQNLGDTILLWDGIQLTGMAVCHCGQGTEAGSDICYVKFGAVCPSLQAEQYFGNLLDACETLAWERRLLRLVAGVGLGREYAYKCMRSRGFQIDRLGVTMHLPNEPYYDRPDVYLIDDWR
ncbi:MAG: GNAT family N-acetyltransferase [Candidatus Loosdrechtia sp.]|uniref:GNAT family N-acetyltransferase n=1 Tax=Candidatus Loosdrechtia sp. TaxID=3101272 RepID=UPI003A6FF805|nr:MAG: GNAT family N-acetyltransferase [Candidatus Jettenia sp. AMX2]